MCFYLPPIKYFNVFYIRFLKRTQIYFNLCICFCRRWPSSTSRTCITLKNHNDKGSYYPALLSTWNVEVYDHGITNGGFSFCYKGKFKDETSRLISLQQSQSAAEYLFNRNQIQNMSFLINNCSFLFQFGMPKCTPVFHQFSNACIYCATRHSHFHSADHQLCCDEWIKRIHFHCRVRVPVWPESVLQ